MGCTVSTNDPANGSRGPALPEQKEIKGIGTYLTVVSLPDMKTDLFGLSGIGEEATFR